MKLTIRTFGAQGEVCVPYHPVMPVREYFGRVLDLVFDDCHCMGYITGSGTIVYLNRSDNTPLGEIVPPETRLFRAKPIAFSNDAPRGQCVICLEDGANFTMKKTCGHSFHYLCIAAYLAGAPGDTFPCPLCRRDMLEDLHDVAMVLFRDPAMEPNRI